MNAEARNRLGAGRVLAMRKFPYYSRILSAMVVCERPGLGKFTADSRWRLYYDPDKVLAWSLDEVAAAWVHCVEHIFRQHSNRFQALEDPRKDPELFQECADVAINEDLKRSGVMMPEPDAQHYFDPVRHPEWSSNMGAEEMYFASRSGGGGDDSGSDGSGSDSEPDSQNDQESPADSPEGSKEDTEGDSSGKQDSSDDESSDSDEQDDTESQGDKDSSGSDSSEDSDKDDEEGSSSESSDGDESDSDEENQDGGSSSSGGDSTDDSDEEDDSSGGSSSGGQSDESSDTEDGSDDASDGDSGEGSMDCGSSVDNVRRDYEERSNDDGSINSVAAENIKKEAAKDIINYANSRPGSVPNSLVREANTIIKPQVDWRKSLMMEIRRGISKKAGQHDRSYKKAARRSLHPKMIMPGRVSPPVPRIAIILDTSGSMSEAVELSIALSEIDNLLKSVAKESDTQSLTIINCDAGANTPIVVRNLSEYEMVGGGGTDMRVGIERAAEMKPLFDVIMTITDGYTPWPRETPKNNRTAKYIACIVGNNTQRAAAQVPKWMLAMEVNMPDKRSGLKLGKIGRQ